MITGFDFSARFLDIPDTIDGAVVTAIAERAVYC